MAERVRDLSDRADRGVVQNQDLANAWIEYTVSPAGQKTLQSFGFLPPPLPVRRRGRGVPLVAVLLALVAVAFFVLPLVGLLKRDAVERRLGRPRTTRRRATRSASRSSARCGRPRFAVVFGVPLAYVLARARFPGRALVRALVVLPMVLPPVVGGVALLYAFQRNDGLVGGWLYDVFDFQFTFSKWGVVLAETFVAMPFLVITVEAGLRSMDRRYEDAAASLGAGRWTVFRRVTVPLIAPALIAGRGAGVGARARRVRCDHHLRRQHPGPHADARRSRSTSCSSRNKPLAIALSLVLLAVSIVVLVSLRDHWFGGSP